MKIGIVLEGGGMRGIYSTGVLDAFLQEKFMADEVVGVSAGASI
ncbi:MAG: patatin-like phospholipase family protein, partial [Oscillospiraceae bacterium]|nr:patatin-like phospholipase family protein [Oscillospiraceae bacterium]